MAKMMATLPSVERANRLATLSDLTLTGDDIEHLNLRNTRGCWVLTLNDG
ncbi:hypothetical protein [Rhodopseudomonas sp.]